MFGIDHYGNFWFNESQAEHHWFGKTIYVSAHYKPRYSISLFLHDDVVFLGELIK